MVAVLSRSCHLASGHSTIGSGPDKGGAYKYLADLSDADLIRRCRTADGEALDVLLYRHADDLYRFCRYLVANRQDAEDICQESLLRAIDRLDSLEHGAAFRGWLFRIARNVAVDLFRHRKRNCALVEGEVTPLPLKVEGPQEAVEVGEDHQIVGRALSRLAQRQRRVLLLREVEGLSYADIGKRLDVSHSAVETLLYRARRRLREEYARAEGAASEFTGREETS
jgi:RNA polymerase sigma factor (sigma-70 family)